MSTTPPIELVIHENPPGSIFRHERKYLFWPDTGNSYKYVKKSRLNKKGRWVCEWVLIKIVTSRRWNEGC